MPEYEPIWEVIAGHDPRATLFLGDNVYIDDPEDVTGRVIIATLAGTPAPNGKIDC